MNLHKWLNSRAVCAVYWAAFNYLSKPSDVWCGVLYALTRMITLQEQQFSSGYIFDSIVTEWKDYISIPLKVFKHTFKSSEKTSVFSAEMREQESSIFICHW